jgi:omega-6 fatty acid desaturase (delta-12 desaturase)
MYLTLDVSYLLALGLAIPAAGFVLRTYIVFHDCAHGSFLPPKRANAWLGVAVGLVVYAPFVSWRHSHASGMRPIFGMDLGLAKGPQRCA